MWTDTVFYTFYHQGLLNKSHVLTFAPDITLPLSKLTATMSGDPAWKSSLAMLSNA
jgi:hypothetical protein